MGWSLSEAYAELKGDLDFTASAEVEPPTLTFAQWLRSQLNGEGTTEVAQFAGYIGVDRQHVQNWLRGIGLPNDHEYALLSLSLKVPVSDLTGYPIHPGRKAA